jgi:hypothetical protein
MNVAFLPACSHGFNPIERAQPKADAGLCAAKRPWTTMSRIATCAAH